jgi:hypothetical protein
VLKWLNYGTRSLLKAVSIVNLWLRIERILSKLSPIYILVIPNIGESYIAGPLTIMQQIATLVANINNPRFKEVGYAHKSHPTEPIAGQGCRAGGHDAETIDAQTN